MEKHEKFDRALANLREIYNREEPYDVVIRTGLVFLYGICFDQSLQAAKEYLEREGFSQRSTGSPRQILKTAFQAGLIQDEDLWLEALAARNDATHAYNEETALSVVSETKEKYYPMFLALQKKLTETR